MTGIRYPHARSDTELRRQAIGLRFVALTCAWRVLLVHVYAIAPARRAVDGFKSRHALSWRRQGIAIRWYDARR